MNCGVGVTWVVPAGSEGHVHAMHAWFDGSQRPPDGRQSVTVTFVALCGVGATWTLTSKFCGLDGPATISLSLPRKFFSKITASGVTFCCGSQGDMASVESDGNRFQRNPPRTSTVSGRLWSANWSIFAVTSIRIGGWNFV